MSMTEQEARARIKNKNILLSFCIVLKNRNDRFTLKFFFFLTVLAFALLFMIPFQYQSVNGSLTASTNQSDDFNNTTDFTTSSADNNQTKPNFTMGIAQSLQNTTKQNSTLSSSIPVQDTNNLVITSPDQEEQQLQSLPSPITQQQNVEGTQLPLLPFEQEIQQPQIFSPPMYPAGTICYSTTTVITECSIFSFCISTGSFSHSITTITEFSLFNYYVSTGSFSHSIATTGTTTKRSLSSKFTYYVTGVTTRDNSTHTDSTKNTKLQ